jgi:CubicO group peptidase (beta-lactamase class C family)
MIQTRPLNMARVLRVITVALVGVVALHAHLTAQQSHAQSLAFSLFEQYVEPLRQQAGIPGLSAAVLQDGQVVWTRGFGHSDVEASVLARSDTPYPIADLTQTFTSAMLLTCVESGLLALDDRIETWSPVAPGAGATLRQLLVHAAPGSATGFKYDPARFAMLAGPVQACGREAYRKRLAQQILERFAMLDAVPGRDILTAPADVQDLFAETALQKYAATLARMAVPYKVDKRGRASRSELPPAGIDAANGLVASVRDLAEYDRGLEVLLTPETLAASWTNNVSNNVALPTGLGWFVQFYEGERLVWHFGLAPDAYSSLYLKIPSRRLTLILVANSDGLTAPYELEKGDVTNSLFAKIFLRLFL